MANGDSTVTEVAPEITVEEIKTFNVFQRLHAIMTELRPLVHDKTVKLRGNDGYKYISHDAVSLAVRPLLSKYRVMVMPSIEQRQDNTNRCELTVQVAFINIDDPKDLHVIQSVGYGVDPSDKGPGKAFSYAMKYAYLKAFCLNAGDDIEQEDTPHEPAAATATQVMETVEQSKAAMKAAADNLKLAISGAGTVDALRTLQRDNRDWLMNAPEVTREYFINLIEARKKELAS